MKSARAIGAGVAAAVTAHDLGAEVILLEKAPEGEEGGNTKVAGQGYLNASSPERAATYLAALCGPYKVPEEMIRVWSEEVCLNNDWLSSVGGDPQEHQHQPVGIEFPDLPGSDCVHKFHDGPKYGYSLTWKRFQSLVKERPIQVCYETPGRNLIQNGMTGEILGITAHQKGKTINVKARKGIVLTCGGFENNQEISKLDIPTTFSEPIKISQSIENAQPSPNVIISDEGKIYVLYQDTVVNEIGTNWAIRQSEELINAGVPIIHYYLMNDTSCMLKILNHLHK